MQARNSWYLGIILFLVLAQPCIAEKGLRISVYADDVLYTGIKYTQLFKIENLDYISGEKSYINVTCGYNISDIKEDVFSLTGLNKYKYANTGEFIPLIPGDFRICGWIINSSANDTNKSDDSACKNIAVLGEQINESINATKQEESESWIKIKDIPDEARFGDMIEIEIEIYKGDTSKYAVYITLEKAAEKTTVHLKGKNTEYSLKIPVQIKPNCDGKYGEGEYELKIEGLDASDEEDIYISGINEKMCEKETIIINDTIIINETKIKTVREECPSNEKLFDVARIKCNADLMKTGRIVYESSSWKAYKLVPFLIIAVLILFLTVLIWKR